MGAYRKRRRSPFGSVCGLPGQLRPRSPVGGVHGRGRGQGCLTARGWAERRYEWLSRPSLPDMTAVRESVIAEQRLEPERFGREEVAELVAELMPE